MFYLLGFSLGLPLAGFIYLMLFSSSVPRKVAGIVASSTVFIAFIGFCCLLYQNGLNGVSYTLWPWVDLPGMKAECSFRLDHLSLLMTLIITGVGFLIHVYSIGYTDHDKDFARYFACMNFFIFAMLLLVLAGDLVFLFIGWESVGLASYLLIGFYYDRPPAAAAALKAFVLNRIGDFGLLLALLLAFQLFGTSDIASITSRSGEFALGNTTLGILTFLLFVGAMGKSAQLPLATWLPDAMEGPTPVSALIHAATMVTAGVYLVVRFYPLFLLTPSTLEWIGIVGAVTALWSALAASGQTDLKRVLAYSTVSQLGLMFVACGAGAFYSAMFHLTTHAFVKALLFLSAGHVVHSLGTNDMDQMGGLKKDLPATSWLFLIGALALSGIPPFATFFSKDLILEQEYLSGHLYLFDLAFLASVLTAFYMIRAYVMTFLGPRLGSCPAKEAPWVMRGPTSILALLAVIGGALGFTFQRMPFLEEYLGQIKLTKAEDELQSGFILTPETWLAVVGAFLGVGIAAFVYLKLRDRLPQNWVAFRSALYLDAFYQKCITDPLKALSNSFAKGFEPFLFEGSIDLTAQGAEGVAAVLQKVQNGQIRSYVAWMALGAGLLLVYFMKGT